MDYTIQAEVERRAQNLAMAKAVARAYPDAQVCWLDEKRCLFVSENVKPDRVTTIEVNGRLVLAAFARVACGGGERANVFLGNTFGEVAIGDIDNDDLDSEARAALLSWVRP